MTPASSGVDWLRNLTEIKINITMEYIKKCNYLPHIVITFIDGNIVIKQKFHHAHVTVGCRNVQLS